MAIENLLYPEAGLLVLRLVIGLVFLYHGIPKLVKSAQMAKMMNWSPLLVFILGLAETLSAFSVVLGYFAQIGAFILALVMVGALYYKIIVWKVPFFAHDKAGWEFDLVLLAGRILLITTGSGAIAFVP